jgi:hypothetical protein
MLETFFLSIHIYFTDINNVIHNEFKFGFFRKTFSIIAGSRGVISDAIVDQQVSSSSQLSFWEVFLQNSAVWRCCGCCWMLVLSGQCSTNRHLLEVVVQATSAIFAKWIICNHRSARRALTRFSAIFTLIARLTTIPWIRVVLRFIIRTVSEQLKVISKNMASLKIDF